MLYIRRNLPQTSTQLTSTPSSLVNTSKTDRKLYIGNLPLGINQSTLVKLLNTALLTLKNTFPPGDPIVSAWISPDGHYAFVEFRTPEETNHGFILNNISILGQQLKVGRPKTYSGMFSVVDEQTITNSVSLSTVKAVNTVAAVLQNGSMNAPVKGRKVQFPTKILCFKGIVKGIDIEDEEKYNEIKNDIRLECELYGKVMEVFMPRKDIDDNKVGGMGNAYVEFATVEDCTNCRKVS